MLKLCVKLIIHQTPGSMLNNVSGRCQSVSALVA